MITSLHLANFKAFAETQHIPIRPLTVIFGANSAGKSSILHALLYLRNALETGDLDAHTVSIGGEAVDLGGFAQFVHRRNLEARMEIGCTLETEALASLLDRRRTETWGRLAESTDWRRILKPEKPIGTTSFIGLRVDDYGEPIPGEKPRLTDFGITGGNDMLMRFARAGDDQLRMTYFNTEGYLGYELLDALVSFATSTEIRDDAETQQLREIFHSVITSFTIPGNSILPNKLSNLSPEQRLPVELAFVSKPDRLEQLQRTMSDLLPRTIDELISGIHDGLLNDLLNVVYLGPLRSFPPRHLLAAARQDPNRFAGGAFAWEVLRDDDGLRNTINDWLGSKERLQTPYRLEVRHLLPTDDRIEAIITNRLEEIGGEEIHYELFDGTPGIKDPEMQARRLKDLLIKKLGRELRELVVLDLRHTPAVVVSHRDIGIGVSQVLPVLAYSYANQGKLIAIEQPEIHLHPALQAELGDVFIESALGERKNTFVLETHSEHLILRIMRRIRETTNGTLPEGLTPIRPEDVSVLYVEPDGSRSIVREMELNASGEFVKSWPGGFFEEGLKELFA